MKHYIALFEYADNSGYRIVFPDFPGLILTGDTYEDAYRMAHEGLAFDTEMMFADGEKLPEPRTLEQIKAEWKDWAKWVKNYSFIVVPISLLPIREKSIRVNITLPEGILQRIDSVSKNRSAFLAQAAEIMLSGNSR